MGSVLTIFICLGGAVIITGIEFVGLVRTLSQNAPDRNSQLFFCAADMMGVWIAIIGMLLLFKFLNVETDQEWFVQLYEKHIHTPVAGEHKATVIVFASLSVIAPLLLNLIGRRAVPPLISVILMAVTYAGFAMEVLLSLQISYHWLIFANIFMMDVRAILNAIRNFREHHRERTVYKSRVLNYIQEVFYTSSSWPVLALLFLLPVIGVTVWILTLFGQAPDAAIRAFTETADWRLSEKIAPPELFYDEHYLCTVAAGGHKKIVRPLRKGIRHGHPVVVNRQLQIANAFEQILEERTPRLHRAVRGFYDKYGFPIARLIRSKAAADVVYILMKPLEWLFLLVLYLTDTKPENRIAIQYTGKKMQDVL